MKPTLICSVICLWASVLSQTLTSAEAIQIKIERKHPFLMGDASLYQRATSRAQKYSWASEAYRSIITKADLLLDKKIKVPDSHGQWAFHYICKICSVRLKFNQGKHECPHCKKVYTGWPYDEVRAMKRHNKIIREHLIHLALAYQMTQSEKYAKPAVNILMTYAKKYPDWPRHTRDDKDALGGAKLCAQTLDESSVMINLAWAYDLLYPSDFFDANKKSKVEQRLLRPGIEILQTFKADYHNWQTWHNSGLLALGFVLKDKKLIEQVLNDPKHGVYNQLNHSIFEDGFWYEGSGGYHFYALNALEYTARMCYYAGLNLYQSSRIGKMYFAPLDYAAENSFIPAIGDSSPVNLKSMSMRYALAYERLKSPDLLKVAKIHPHTDQLLWGPESLPEFNGGAQESKNFYRHGVVVMKKPSANGQHYVHFDYNTTDMGHGHADKLAVVYQAFGTVLGDEAGRVSYTSPLYKSWYRQTAAHNTVVLNGVSSHYKARGKLLEFKKSDKYILARAMTRNAYKEATLIRGLVLTGNYLLDVFEVISKKKQQMDWIWHGRGELTFQEAVKLKPGGLSERGAYAHVNNPRHFETDNQWQALFEDTKGNLHVTMSGSKETRIIIGNALNGYPPQRHPMLIARREGAHSIYVTLLEAYLKKPKAELKKIREGEGELNISVELNGEIQEHVVKVGLD